MFHFETKKELTEFIEENFLTSVQVSDMLGCSRANVSDLVKRGKLIPAIEFSQTSLFWAEDINARIQSNPKVGRPKNS